MRQLADLLVWLCVVTVVAGAIYFTPHIIQQVSNPGTLSYSAHTHPGENCAICRQGGE